jgi:flagellar basal-body rod protein FlgF
MLAASYRQTAVANNIANIGTNGYRAEVTSNLAFASLLVRRVAHDNITPFGPASGEPIGRVGTGVLVNVSRPDLTQGPLQQTGNPLDVALSGQGFFVLQSPEGPILSRDGHFGLDAQRRLVNAQGYFVLGENGPITLAPGNVAIAADGALTLDGGPVDRLKIVSYAAGDLIRVGDTAFVPADGGTAIDPTATVAQGTLEGANVDATMLMTEMMKVSSTFQSAQKVFQTVDGTLGRIINDVARF